MGANGGFRLTLVQFCLVLVYTFSETFSASAQNPLILPQNALPLNAGSLVLADLMAEVDENRLMGHVEALQNMQTRHVASVQDNPDEGIGAASDYIYSQFEAAGGSSVQVSTQEFYILWAERPMIQENVIATLPGTAPDSGVIIVGAHYDSRCENINDGRCYAPGANDNGSGVAALIEMARVLSPRQHRTTIILVAFAAEEIGRAGSIAFVRDYIAAQQIPVLAMINIDMIGCSSGHGEEIDEYNIRLFSEGPDNSPSRILARTINLMAFQYIPDMEISLQYSADRPGRYGDQMSFTEMGYPAVRFIEMQEDAAHQHNGMDTIEYMQPACFRRSTQTIMAVVTLLADGPVPPVVVSLSANPDGTRSLIWEPVADVSSYVVTLHSSNAPEIDLHFEVHDTTVVLDNTLLVNFETVAVAAKDSSGLMGTLSTATQIN